MSEFLAYSDGEANLRKEHFIMFVKTGMHIVGYNPWLPVFRTAKVVVTCVAETQ